MELLARDTRDISSRMLLPSFRRSQSVTAIANLQKELEFEEQATALLGDEDATTKKPGLLERCASLPYLKLRGGELLSSGGPSNDGDGDNMSVTSAGKMSEDIQEMVSNMHFVLYIRVYSSWGSYHHLPVIHPFLLPVYAVFL